LAQFQAWAASKDAPSEPTCTAAKVQPGPDARQIPCRMPGHTTATRCASASRPNARSRDSGTRESRDHPARENCGGQRAGRDPGQATSSSEDPAGARARVQVRPSHLAPSVFLRDIAEHKQSSTWKLPRQAPRPSTAGPGPSFWKAGAFRREIRLVRDEIWTS